MSQGCRSIADSISTSIIFTIWYPLGLGPSQVGGAGEV